MQRIQPPELGSSIVNEACWKVLEALPSYNPDTFNNLKPAFLAGLTFVLEKLQEEPCKEFDLALAELSFAMGSPAVCGKRGDFGTPLLKLAAERFRAALSQAGQGGQGEAWGWAIIDKNGTAQAIRPRKSEFFGALQEREPFTPEDILKMSQEWPGLAPHNLLTLYAAQPAPVPQAPRHHRRTPAEWAEIAELEDLAGGVFAAGALVAPVASAAMPDVLFDGFEVLKALAPKAQARTSADNVSDVLDAVVKLIRAQQTAPAVPAVAKEVLQLSEHMNDRNNALRLYVSDLTAVMLRMVEGIDHLNEIARQWEPDHSSGADRRRWVLAKDSRDDALRLLQEHSQRIGVNQAAPKPEHGEGV